MLSVFLVDDEAIILRGLKKLIPWEKFGFRIAGQASNGEEALKKITPQNTDIVITDLKMPMLDGIGLCEQLRKRMPGIHCIVLTAYDDFSLLQQSIRNGVDDYILKPVKATNLTESLYRIQGKIEQEQYSFSYVLENRLIHAAMCQEEPLDEALEEFCNYAKANKIPLPVFRRLCRNLLYRLDEQLEEGGGLVYVVPESVIRTLSSEESTEEACVLALRRILGSVQEYQQEKCGSALIGQIKRYIEKNIGGGISLNEIAERFYINPSYLSQLFKKDTGMNYSTYLNDLRMAKAKRLLEEGSFSIADISELVGYSDYRYFSQNFKRYTGRTPSEYRAEEKKD